MKNYIRSKSGENEYFISYLFAFIPRVVLILLFAYPLRVTGDELFLFAVPAKLAGLDWGGVMSRYRYYGPGFSVFLTPLFIYLKDPVLIYRITLIIVAALQSTIALMSCHILKRFFKIENSFFIITTSIMCAYCMSQYPTYMYNEHIYVICVWGVAICCFYLVEYIENKKKKILFSVLLTFVFLYALSVHARAITLVIAFLIVYILFYLLFNKKIAYLSPIILGYGIGNMLNNKLTEKIVNSIAIKSTDLNILNIQNTQVSFSIPKEIVTDNYFQIAVRNIILGQLDTWNVFTGGMAIVSLVLGCYLWIQVFQKRIDFSSEFPFLLIWTFFMGCIVITILGQSFQWGMGVAEALKKENYSADSLRALTYLRYLCAYFPPVLLITNVYFLKETRVFEKIRKYILLILLLLTSLWVKLILPFAQNTYIGLGEKAAFSFVPFGKQNISISNYLPGILSVFLIFSVLCMLIKKKKAVYISSVLFLLFFFQYNSKVILGDGQIGKIDYYNMDNIAKALNVVESVDKDIPIYVSKMSILNTFQGSSHELQFLLPDKRLQEGLPAENVLEAIFVSNTLVEGELNEILKEYVAYQLDEYEYLYIKGKRIQKIFEEKGIEGAKRITE